MKAVLTYLKENPFMAFFAGAAAVLVVLALPLLTF
jgi:hypothetical protein